MAAQAERATAGLTNLYTIFTLKGKFYVKPIREIIPEGAPLGICCFEQDKPKFDHEYHHHPEIEITYIRSSEGQFLIGDATGSFGPGDLYLLGENLPHRFKNWNEGRARSLVVQFREDAFGEALFKLPGFKQIHQRLRMSQRGILFRGQEINGAVFRRLRDIMSHSDRPSGLGGLLSLLEELSQSDHGEILCGPGYAHDPDQASSDRLARVLGYIDERWNEPIRLDEVARRAALHPQSLSRFFRRHLGTTFQAYLVRIRISHAARKLIETDAGVTEIALNSGFDNLANFHRHFRKTYGTSPGQYRKRFGN